MKVYIKTYGCAANQARSEKLASIVASKHELVQKPGSSDAVILNTCSLKQPTENAMFRLIKENQGKKIIVAGCFPLSFPNHPQLEGLPLVGTYDFDKILRALSSKTPVRFLSGKKKLLRCNSIRASKLIAKIEIGTGCLGNCAYCAGKLAHGGLKSKPAEQVLAEVKDAVSSGCKEVWLSSQDNGCYGFDIGTNITKLVEQVASLPGDFRIRVGMMNPNWALKLLPKLKRIFQLEKVYAFAHLPVQSGDNEILKAMNRQYTVSEFKRVVRELRKVVPNVAIATDVILGLPGETNASFEKTVKLVKEIRPETLNISRFWVRPNTKAASMSYMHHKHSKKMSRELDKIYNQIATEINEKLVGKTFDVLFTGRGTKPNQYRGRTMNYTPVVVNSEEQNLLGRTASVKITSASKDHVLGKIYLC